MYYKYQTHVISNLGKKNETPFLALNRLGEYSTKIEAMIKNIIASSGLVYIYSEFIESGTLPIALALEQEGYERYVLSNENQLLDYSKIRLVVVVNILLGVIIAEKLFTQKNIKKVI